MSLTNEMSASMHYLKVVLIRLNKRVCVPRSIRHVSRNGENERTHATQTEHIEKEQKPATLSIHIQTGENKKRQKRASKGPKHKS